MSYPGSSTLSQEIQQRVLTTFEQTLDLADSGSVQEAKLGCDFILQLDSLFQPARLLRERLEGASGAVPTGDLRDSMNAEAAPTESPSVDLGDLDDLNLDIDLDLGAGIGSDSGTLDVPALDSPTSLPSLDSASTDLLGGGLDTPLPAMPSASAGGIDLGGTGGSEDARIEELLAEGQAAFESKSYQSAIDAWSRIFLIDVDHGEAGRRIELARNLKAEHERQVEESFHEAMSLLDAGSMDEAKAQLESVLTMEPDHLTAKEYLEKIEAGTAAAAPPPIPSTSQLSAPALSDVPDEAPAPGAALSDLGDVDDLLQDPSDIPPADVDIDSDPISEGPTQKKKASRAAPSKAFLAIGSGVLLLVLAVGGFLWTKWDSMFPNSEEAAPTAVNQPDPIARAQKLHEAGKTANAIGILGRLSPDDADYQEAQALIEQWQVAEQAESEGEEAAGPTEEDLALREILISQAEEAANQRRNVRAESLLRDAADIAPLDEELQELRDTIADEIAPISSELAMFRQGDWEYAVPNLWRMVDRDPSNLDARQLLADAYYNLGVRDLQRGDLKGAAGHFAEIAEIAEDAEAERLLGFANTYLGRSEDLLYKTFVKYLPFREI